MLEEPENDAEINNAEAKATVEKCLGEFRDILTQRQLDEFQGAQFETIEQYIHNTQRTQEELGTLMNFSRMGIVLETFRNFDTTWHKLGINVEGFSGYLWGPVRFILKTTNEDQVALDSVLDAYEQLGTKVHILRDKTYLEQVVTTPCLRICLALMYKDLLCFHRTTIKFITYKGWKRAFKANWNDYTQQSFATILASFQEHIRVLQRTCEDQQRRELEIERERLQKFFGQAQQQTDRLSSSFQDLQGQFQGYTQRYEEDQAKVRSIIRQYHNDRAILLANAAEAKAKRDQDSFAEVQRWISGPREIQARYHDKFRMVREEFPGTSTWILQETKLWNWMRTEFPIQSILWVNGKKGAGKTVLASSIIDECKKVSDSATSYFYFREDDPGQNTCMAMCKALLQQMLAQCREVLPSFYESKRYSEERLVEQSKTKNLMEIVCDRSKSQFIIIDGLDECIPAERRQAIQILASLVEGGEVYDPGKIRLLLVSTYLPDLASMKPIQNASVLEIGAEDIGRDIEAFASQKSAELRSKYRYITDNDVQAARYLTCARCSGMFLFATLAMENLLKQPNLGEFRRQLNKDMFPHKLDEAYQVILDRLQRDLSPTQWAEARKIFGWLACAKRPLLWHELQAALAITEEDGTRGLMNFAERQLEDDITDICGSLVQVIDSCRIEFIHQSARRYVLESETLSEASIEYDLAIMCLRYLCFPFFHKNLPKESRKRFIDSGCYAFQDYAISKWHRHIEAVIKHGPEALLDINGGHLHRLHAALDGFYKRYHKNMQKVQGRAVGEDTNGLAAQALDRAKNTCAPFSHLQLSQLLVQVWSHVTLHEQQPIKERSKISLEDLADSLKQTREMLTDLFDQLPQDSRKRQGLRGFYGHRLHKCERVTCDLFFDGFDTESHLKKHIKRHDRPFECPVESCHLSHLAFVNHKDLEKHIDTYHPDMSDRPSQYCKLKTRPTEKFKHHCDFEGGKATYLYDVWEGIYEGK